MPNISVYISQEAKDMIPELLEFYHAPSVSKLVEEALKLLKEEMPKENPQVL